MDCGFGVAVVVVRGLVYFYLVFLGLAVEELVSDDRYYVIYFAMLLVGVGFLLLYNSFIIDVDFLYYKYLGGFFELRFRIFVIFWKFYG